ncbi:MAG: ABC transporter ATP-binding protein, partial [Pseudoalteromonas sp.]
PSANLDSKNGKMIESLLFELNKEHGTTLILVTHDEALADKCQQVLHIEAGQLVESQTSEGAKTNVG